MNKTETVEFSSCIKTIIRFHNLSLCYNRVLNKVSDHKGLSSQTIEQTHEAMLLKQITEWEQFCIDIIAYGVSMDTTKLSKHLFINLPKQITIDNAYAIINGLNMFNVYSTGELKRSASKILTARYNPFQQFLKPMLRHIDEAILIRNYIAHKSRSSKNKLMNHYRKNCKMEQFIAPGFFLASTKKTDIGVWVCYQLYAWIFMTMAILTWRLLDRKTYDLAFDGEKSPTSSVLGMVRMNKIFEDISKAHDIPTF